MPSLPLHSYSHAEFCHLSGLENSVAQHVAQQRDSAQALSM